MPFFNIRSRANSRSLSIAGRANTQWRICVGRILLLGIGLGIAHPAVAGTNAHADDAYEAQENSIVIAFLKNRLAVEKKPFCFNATLMGIPADYWETLKTYALRRKLPPEARTLVKDLKSVSTNAKQQNIRAVDLLAITHDGLSVRPATFDECKYFEGYTLYRVAMTNKKAIFFGANGKFNSSIKFAMNMSKNTSEWTPNYYHVVSFVSGPPSSGQFKEVHPGQGNTFFIIGEPK